MFPRFSETLRIDRGRNHTLINRIPTEFDTTFKVHQAVIAACSENISPSELLELQKSLTRLRTSPERPSKQLFVIDQTRVYQSSVPVK